VASVAEGLKVRGAALADAFEVEIPPERRNDRGWPVAILAARIAGHDFDGQVGAWAVGGDGVGPIMALDSVAREWSSWGEAAQPGSKAMEVVERLAGYPETRTARDAVRAGS
jgi:hypothetical protein